MASSLRFFGVGSILMLIAACGDSASNPASSSGSVQAASSEIAACVERGVAYFKEIGSYPTLSSAPNTGRSAEDVAAERCGRTTTAF